MVFLQVTISSDAVSLGELENFHARILWFQHCRMQMTLCSGLLFCMTSIFHKQNSVFYSCASGFEAVKCGLSMFLPSCSTHMRWCDCICCESHQTGSIND